MTLAELNELLVWNCAIATVISVAIYARRPWRRNVVGRQLMAYMVGLALLFSTIVVQMLIGPTVWLPRFSALVFLLYSAAVDWRLYLLVKLGDDFHRHNHQQSPEQETR